MDNSEFEKKSSLKYPRVNSYELQIKKKQNNFNKKATINSDIQILEKFHKNFPFSPKAKKKVEIQINQNYQKKV
jgi:hypothetical protein